MTWIIGDSVVFGYGMMISDVQVTLGNGERLNILQKAFPIANYLVAGFSGSVRIGLMLLESLSLSLKQAGYSPEHEIDPCHVASKWATIARKVFESAPISEKKHKSSILMVGTSPIEKFGN